MKKGELIVAFVLEGLGIWVAIDSYKLGLQTLGNPGAGFFPFLSGILLCILILPICINSLKDLRKVNRAVGEKLAGYQVNLKKRSAVLACLIGYFLFLNILGFLITTSLFMYGLFCVGIRRKWLFILVFSVVVAGLSYIIFDVLLQISFPSGFFR